MFDLDTFGIFCDVIWPLLGSRLVLGVETCVLPSSTDALDIAAYEETTVDVPATAVAAQATGGWAFVVIAAADRLDGVVGLPVSQTADAIVHSRAEAVPGVS